jgi:hypothetical protein
MLAREGGDRLPATQSGGGNMDRKALTFHLEAPAAKAQPNFSDASQVGRNARFLFQHAKFRIKPIHPPLKFAFYPIGRDVTVAAAIGYLAATAGRRLRQGKGIPVLKQAKAMLELWYRDGMDPMSYYSLELWRPRNLARCGSFLTRVETKNGLFTVLNQQRPKPFKGGNEMANKLSFSKICKSHGLPHAETLLAVMGNEIDWYCDAENLQTDLFLKHRTGRGASGTQYIWHRKGGEFKLEDETSVSLPGLLDHLKRSAAHQSILVQRRLKNHKLLSAWAKESLLAVRVVTCLDEVEKPEITHAMLRLLTKLEPEWKKTALDMEYACPINLATGEIGQMTGDNMNTSHLRYDDHPFTHATLRGTFIPEWIAIKRLALSAHKVFQHRAVIGWDIAITNEGPILLEGNSNLDIMFLQRVHDQPIGLSRLGSLLNHHMKHLFAS